MLKTPWMATSEGSDMSEVMCPYLGTLGSSLKQWTKFLWPKEFAGQKLQCDIMCVGFPGGASGKEPVCQCRRGKRYQFNPWVRKIPWRRKWQPAPVFLSRKSHGQRSLVVYSPWGHKESDMAERVTLSLSNHDFNISVNLTELTSFNLYYFLF